MFYIYPIYKPDLSGNEKKYVNECLDSTWISSKGKFIGEFEEKFADFVGVKYAAAVPNGTIALHLALVTLGIGPGDEVIVPTFTYVASVNSVSYTGAKPVFADSTPQTWQIDPLDIEKQISEHSKAIMPVHLYGHPCDMDKIKSIANQYGLFVIEDCAESFGSKYKDIQTGTFGDIAAFSFFGNKTITTGEGGMIVTNDRTIYDRAVHFKGQGLAKFREYWHDVIGYNYRMTNICAAIGLAQLERAEEIISKKREVASWYKEFLADLPVTFQTDDDFIFNTYWIINVLVEKAELRDELREFLRNAQIETRPTFYPVHTMPMYVGKYRRIPVAEDISARGVSLPSYPALTKQDVKFICDQIVKFYDNSV